MFAVRVCGSVALAIAQVHASGFAYRDLHSSNVMFDYDGTVKLIDFSRAMRVLQADLDAYKQNVAHSFEIPLLNNDTFYVAIFLLQIAGVISSDNFRANTNIELNDMPLIDKITSKSNRSRFMTDTWINKTIFSNPVFASFGTLGQLLRCCLSAGQKPTCLALSNALLSRNYDTFSYRMNPAWEISGVFEQVRLSEVKTDSIRKSAHLSVAPTLPSVPLVHNPVLVSPPKSKGRVSFGPEPERAVPERVEANASILPDSSNAIEKAYKRPSSADRLLAATTKAKRFHR
jgi:serine/threonine protein kinase